MEYGYKLGLNSQERFDTYLKEHKEIEDTKQLLKEIHVGKNEKVVEYVKSKDYLDVDPNVSFDSLLRRQRMTITVNEIQSILCHTYLIDKHSN